LFAKALDEVGLIEVFFGVFKIISARGILPHFLTTIPCANIILLYINIDKNKQVEASKRPRKKVSMARNIGEYRHTICRYFRMEFAE
jgi:hypothetical protein